MYKAADTRELTAFDVAAAEKTPIAEVHAAIGAGHRKMEAWLAVIQAAEEAVAAHPEGCPRCGIEKCSGGEECDKRTSRLVRVRKIIPIDEALKVRTTPAVWRRVIRKNRDELNTVYEMFKASPYKRTAEA